MKREVVAQKVEEILRDNLGLDEDVIIKEDTDLEDSLGMDSLDAAEMNMSLEEEFGVEISEDEGSEMKTFGQVVSLIFDKA